MVLPLIVALAVVVASIIGAIFYFQPNAKAKQLARELLWRERIESLNATIFQKLFGQTLAHQAAIAAFKNHFDRSEDDPPKKPLVLVLAGSPGLGKTFLAESIILPHFIEWSGSKSTRSYIGPGHFPNTEPESSHRDKIRTEVLEQVRRFPQSLFLFDEIGKLPPSILNELSSYLDVRTECNGVDFRKSVFIFLTNTGGSTIDKITQTYRPDSSSENYREDLTLSNFSRELEVAIATGSGGLKNVEFITRRLYDFLIPFLPLERQHVLRCIELEMSQPKYMQMNISPERIMNNMMTWFPDEETGLYATHGAKQVDNHVLRESFAASSPRRQPTSIKTETTRTTNLTEKQPIVQNVEDKTQGKTSAVSEDKGMPAHWDIYDEAIDTNRDLSTEQRNNYNGTKIPTHPAQFTAFTSSNSIPRPPPEPKQDQNNNGQTNPSNDSRIVNTMELIFQQIKTGVQLKRVRVEERPNPPPSNSGETDLKVALRRISDAWGHDSD